MGIIVIFALLYTFPSPPCGLSEKLFRQVMTDEKRRARKSEGGEMQNDIDSNLILLCSYRQLAYLD